MNAVGTPLKDWGLSINRGILTGYNDAFIISAEKRDEILSNCISEEERQRTAELIRPILRGKDIKKYKYSFADLWLIYVPWHFPLQFDASIQGASTKAESEFMKQYPAIYAHLVSFKKELSARNKAETGIRYEWYALQRWGSNYWEDFDKPRIIYREIGPEMDACLIEKGILINNKLYMIAGENLEFLLLFLNSTLFNKIILTAANITGGKGVDFMNEIKVPFPSEKQMPIIKELLTADDKQRDCFINSLYNFSEEEMLYLSSL